jgi:hypothetical protein
MGFVDVGALALTDRRFVGDEPEPVEILEYGALELGPAALRVVILDPQQDAAAPRARNAPDLSRAENVSEMEIPGRCGCEAGDDRRLRDR